MNEGILFLKNSKRIRKYIHLIKAKTRKIENKKIQDFVKELEKIAQEFELIEQEYRDGNKKEAKQKYKIFVERNKEIVDKINNETFKKLLKILGIISITTIVGLLTKELFGFLKETNEFGDTRIDRALKNDDELFQMFIDRKSKEYEIDPKLVRGIIQQESDWKKHLIATNKNGTKDYGLMQLNSGYLKYYKEKFWDPNKKFDPLDPRNNVEMGIKYLSFLLKYYKGNIDKVIQAYNIGPTAFDKGKTAAKYLKDVKTKMG